RAVASARAHRGDAVHELGLADRALLSRAARTVHRHALDEHGGDHVMAAARVGQQLVEEVTALRMVPEVMVRIDDRQVGLENGFVDHGRESTTKLSVYRTRDIDGR